MRKTFKFSRKKDTRISNNIISFGGETRQPRTRDASAHKTICGDAERRSASLGYSLASFSAMPMYVDGVSFMSRALSAAGRGRAFTKSRMICASTRLPRVSSLSLS